MKEYLIPKKEVMFSQEIKKSRFICIISHAPTITSAHSWIKEIRQEYHDANHVCWAFIAGPPNSTQQSMSDDGEPSGTAGKPMLNVLQHSNIGDIAAVVIRYFGGTKLGTGGLVRAYSSSVSEAMKILTSSKKINHECYFIECKYPDEKQVQFLIKNYEGKITTITYQETIHLITKIPETNVAAFLEKLPYNITATKLD